MLKKYTRDLEDYLKNKLYMVCIIITAILAFGFSITNITVGIDDLECGRYIGSGNELLRSGRFSWLFWTNIFGIKNRYVENSFIFEVVGVIFLLWAAINFCILFKKVSFDKIEMPAYTVFSCIMISYPLMNEIWGYTGVNITICGSILFISFALILMREQLLEGFDVCKYGLSSFMLMIVCAGYESAAVVYVFMVSTILFFQVLFEKERKESYLSLIKQGSFYASVLAVGLVLRIIVHRSLLFVMNLSVMRNGDTAIWWGKLPVQQVISDIIRGIIKEYFVKGIIYFPITEFVCCIVVFCVLCIVLLKKKNKAYWLPAVGMLISLFLLTLIQGRVSPYRACQVFSFFVAVVMMLLVHFTSSSKIKGVRTLSVAIVMVSGLLCIHQASTMNYYLTLNYLRSEEEARTICNIGEDLNRKYNLEKPVIFTGTYTLSDELRQKAMISKDDIRWSIFSEVYGLFSDKDIYNGEEYRKLPDSNVNSVIDWALGAFGSQDSLQKLFNYYGFDYQMADYSVLNDAEKYVQENRIPGYPNEGYIFERDNYIIVNLK